MILCSPCFKNNTICKKLILRNTSTSKSLTLSKKSDDHKKKNENHQILISFKREKNILINLIEKQKKEIEKLQKKSNIYTKQLTSLEKENKKLNKQIKDYSINQDQLILLIKIVQTFGVDIEQLIDEYNQNINNNINNCDNINNTNNEGEEEIYYDKDMQGLNFNESTISELDIKTEINSFIPITIFLFY